MGFLPDRSKVVLRCIIERQASENPDKECIAFENDERWTYGEALLEAYRASNVLRRIGVQRGKTILIFLPNGKDFIRAWWGAAFLGAIVIPVNTAYKGEMLRHVCHDSSASHIVTTPDLSERIRDLGLDLQIIDPAVLAEGLCEGPKMDEWIEPWDIHSIIYTSGTTGPSKGVMCTYFQVYSNGYTPMVAGDETMLIDLPLYHVGGMVLAYTGWTFGGRVALHAVFSGSRYWDRIRETGATIAAMLGTIPAFLEKMPPRLDDSDNPLRAVVCAPMVNDPEAFMKRFGIKGLYTHYGSTEMNTVLINGPNVIDPKSCGRVRPGFEVRLVDDHDIPVPTGEVGELIVRHNLPWVLTLGYWRRAEETARAWRNGWFHSGDLLRRDEEGNYFFADRKKDGLRRRGENISSFEVEREVMSYPDVLEAACIGVPSEFGEDEIKVFVVLHEGINFHPETLIHFLVSRMPYFMVPRFVEVVPKLPKTATNRIKKYELRSKGVDLETWDREAAGLKVTRNS